jgi:regulator of replication initiation timing
VPTGEVDKVIMQQLSAVFRTPSILAKVHQEADKIESEQKKSLLEKNAELEMEMEDLRQRIRGIVEISSSDPEITVLIKELQKIETEFNENKNRIDAIKDDAIGNNYICEAFNSIDILWDELFPVERYRLAHLLIKKVTIFRDNMRIELKTSGIDSLVWEISDIIGKSSKCDAPKRNTENVRAVKPAIQPDGNIILNVPIKIKHKNGRKLIIAPQALDGKIPDAQSPVKEPVALAIARAHAWLKLLESGEVKTITQLAEKLNLERSYVSRILRMINLAPDIQEAIINGNESDNITMEKFKCAFPGEWQEQRRLFGMA